MGERRRASAVTIVMALVLGVLVVGGGAVLWKRGHRSELRDAVDVVPRSTQRLSYTDWAGVRAQLGVKGTGAAAVEKLASRGYDTDLSAVSSVDESTAALQENFGFSPLTMQWEAYGQAAAGATMVARMPDGFDFEKVTDHLAELGFQEPKQDDGVWEGGTDLVASIDPTITPELQYVAVLADEHLVVTSDTAEYAAVAAAVARGDKPSLGDLDSVRELVGKTDDPVAAMVWPRDFVCTDLAMSQADQDSQDAAQTLIDKAGKVTPMTGMLMALTPDRQLEVVQLYESSGQAKENLEARAKLAVGDALGRGGSFGDELKLTDASTDGAAVRLVFEPRKKTGFVLSALDSGPVLFATC
ncbi:hypothetical protein [Marmoricola sp. RAF53]|uniref:hypothetical protein n=1 Tax=Marmoricola sp. RAF53 TaxID=3233059 RepID=UPI003F9D0128